MASLACPDRTHQHAPGTLDPAVRELRRQILEAAAASAEGHVPSAFSVLDVLWILYHEVLQVNPRDPAWPERDRFVLSKGHASLGLYAVLAASGFFPADELRTFAQAASRLGGHPDRTKVPGVEASTGSLGHGFPMAVGMALALRIRGSRSRVFALVGDGECNEGSVWEAAMLAAHHRLDRLTCIVDYNHSGDRALGLGDLVGKFRSFGWEASAVDGHDHQALRRVLAPVAAGRPVVVVAETIKGHGCPPLENEPAWHHRAPTAVELPRLLEALR
jgi:transketolase